MLTYRLIHLIETHSSTLAQTLLHKIQKSEMTRAYTHVPIDELQHRVSEIYLHLGEWLTSKSDGDIDKHYNHIGMRRAEQGVPLSQLVWAIVLTKDTLWDFILNDAAPDRPVELFGRQELLRLLDHFFDRAIHAAAVGHEWANEHISKANNSGPRKVG